jgi:hypothetical protein
MTEAEVQQWVEANPGRVNDRDCRGQTTLYAAAASLKSAALVLWLTGEYGAEVDATSIARPLFADSFDSLTALHGADPFDILITLLDCGANPTLLDGLGQSLLIKHAGSGNIQSVVRLLQDPRVRATINRRGLWGQTALHCACQVLTDYNRDCIVHLLLRAGANPFLTEKNGKTPVACLRMLPSNHATISLAALLAQAPNAEKASLLVKARRLVIAATSSVVMPSYLRERVLRGKPLPRAILAPVLIGYNGDELHNKLGIMLIHLFGV